MTLIGPRVGMTAAAFHAHWSGPHAEIAKDLPGLTYYVQNHVMRTLWQGGQAQDLFLGIAEVMFADPDRLLDTIATWPRRAELHEDEARFLGARIGNWTQHPDNPPRIAHRRMILLLCGASAAAVRDAVQAISQHAPCHAEPVLDGDAGAIDWIVFVELSPERIAANSMRQMLSVTGPMLRHVTEVGGSGLAYLTYTQVNRLPFDRF
ncbi:EthD domain-containing protein [Phaeovulum sp. NW3]|uniref:EthD domain-containing protein n=1 Tax=Phaeovulum sp. NW3 TaxID=2934933 RepID=UPI0020215BCB|nr:EthD domain-containing protein [Phaeovulum sp. NW3]